MIAEATPARNSITARMAAMLASLQGAYLYDWFRAKRRASTGTLLRAEASAAAPGPDEPLVRLCAWCGRLGRDNLDEIQWVSADEFPPDPGRAITHGICKDCEHELT